MDIVEITEGTTNQIRKTNEMPPRVSVYDVISAMNGKSIKDATVYWINLKKKYPEVSNNILSHFKFPGQGQRPTPVTDARGIVDIIKLLPGINPHDANTFGKRLAKYIGVDPDFVQDAVMSKGIPKVVKERDEDVIGRLLSEIGETFTRQKRVGGHYIDYEIPKPWGFILLEVDENQHSSYDVLKDNKRTMSIMAEYGEHATLFIRYNPHKYVSDGRVVRSSHATRKSTLRAVISGCKPVDNFNILYLYYDTNMSIPSVLLDPQFSSIVRSCVLILGHDSMSLRKPVEITYSCGKENLALREENRILREELKRIRLESCISRPVRPIFIMK
jgi:very-short-patch-repair endonuclease